MVHADNHDIDLSYYQTEIDSTSDNANKAVMYNFLKIYVYVDYRIALYLIRDNHTILIPDSLLHSP